MNSSRILIVCGGSLGAQALQLVKEKEPSDVLIGVDRGAWWLVKNGFKLEGAFGDFDSVTEDEAMQIKAASDWVKSFDAIDKDWTDSELAMHWALERKPKQIILLGATGTRFDHTLANIYLLQKALEAGIDCRLIDEHNEIKLIDRTSQVMRSRHPYISLISISDQTTGITLEGFRYPLHNATLKRGQALGVSNVLLSNVGTIHLDHGLLLVIQSED
ncbi:thiamine diphosphokinase [Paenibacillus albiflavus]|uniref:Thiamine diphosphokinase n=1 Tax=Paenibacillus albiflavus TaxID=2545760 RepID=A0A4R4EF52_9BACL|nr:thiamine diphosphokinase [Paenibacillus albiflavus]TCZ77863.1 thiamine diphosphokinase [Paenibacillus albiflavus]